MSARERVALRRAAVAPLALAMALACAGEQTAPWPEIRPDVPSPVVEPDRAPDAPLRPEPGSDVAAGALQLHGSWAAAPCGRRNYERRLALDPGGEARLEEWISPCPAGAQCVWSGIEVVDGRWRRADDSVLLELDEVSRPMAVDPPSRLTVRSRGGEIVLEEEGGCRYVRPPATSMDPAPEESAEPASLP